MKPKQMITVEEASAFPLFRGLCAEELSPFLAKARRLYLSAKEVLLREGYPAEGVYFCLSGAFKASKISPSGREQVLAYFGPKDMFGLLQLITERPNPATIACLKDAELVFIGADEFRALLGRFGTVAVQAAKVLGDRLAAMASLVEDIALYTVESRLAGFLFSRQQDGGILLDPWETQAEISAILGTVPEVLNRVLASFKRRGIITGAKREFRILDQEALRKIGVNPFLSL